MTASKQRVPAHIFREYDIRGIADSELTSETVKAIGQAYRTYLSGRGVSKVTVGCDARLSSPRVKTDVMEGLVRAGVSVLDIGLVATPTFYWSL